jgi:hypothetical protein
MCRVRLVLEYGPGFSEKHEHGPKTGLGRASNAGLSDPDTAHRWSGLGKIGPIKPNLFNLVRYQLLYCCDIWSLCGQIMQELFNIFNLVSYKLYLVVIF